MTLVRRLARPCIAGIFISGGLDQLRAPQTKSEKADPVAQPITKALPWLPEDTETLVRVNGAVQVGAGALLALGKLPRLSALALAASLVPTTAAGHAFWSAPDGATRAAQRTQFLKNLSILGGLLLAAVDTAGDPSLAWRAKHAAKDVSRATRSARRATAAAPTRVLKAVA
ncbi:DoxX-like protein [Motilibacter peucedani]|uniref:DoxX-like protein n=1 Tax=Motilibacter peucedani TaxID=598650 RepID=A0A420XLL9_9ACTN|nr:DoxX family protein [Motilibacter peucedani]RKS71405.1 DoxX-like protein [Motilibacter peucedani]